MILDLHSHSVRSDDGRAKVENYCQWIRRKQLPLDGFVLTEHRQFDVESDYRNLNFFKMLSNFDISFTKKKRILLKVLWCQSK